MQRSLWWLPFVLTYHKFYSKNNNETWITNLRQQIVGDFNTFWRLQRMHKAVKYFMTYEIDKMTIQEIGCRLVLHSILTLKLLTLY